jgi:hypothetical protein
MRLTDFCNRFSKRAPARTFDSRGERYACAQRFTCDGAKAPAHDPSESAVDVAPPASTDPLTKDPRLATRFRAPHVPGGFLRSVDPRAAPHRHGVFGRGRGGRIDLWRSLSSIPEKGRNPFDIDQNRFHRRLVKGQRLLRPGAPSTDECSLGAAFTTPRARARHPRFRLGRPTRASDALSPPANGKLDTAAFASSSLASARRRAPLVDFCNQIRSQARPSDRRNSRLGGLRRLSPQSSPCLDPLPPCEGAGPRSHGSGAGDPG